MRRASIPWHGAALLALAVLLGGCGRKLTYYHPNGVMRCEGSTVWDGMEPHGPWMYWYPNGEPREQGRYERGRRVGVWTQWHPNGQKHSEGERIWVEETAASERHGPWTFWWPEGQIRARGSFDQGELLPGWRFWHPDGTAALDETRPTGIRRID